MPVSYEPKGVTPGDFQIKRAGDRMFIMVTDERGMPVPIAEMFTAGGGLQRDANARLFLAAKEVVENLSRIAATYRLGQADHINAAHALQRSQGRIP